jgi:protease-4
VLILAVCGLLAVVVMGGVLTGLFLGQAGSAAKGAGLVEQKLSGEGREKIAAIWVEGILTHSGGGIGGPRESIVTRVVRQLDRAENDDAVKGVVLVVDSPGGTVTASDVLYERVRRFRASGKKVVTVVRDLAASGGYYVAAASDSIVCHRTGLTGSIGVIWPYFDLSKLIRDKFHITYTPIKSTPKKDMGSPARPLTEEERRILEAVVRDAHERFVEVVAEGRANLSKEQAAKLADGSIYTAPQALANGLVDTLGYFDDGVEKAKALCNLTEATVVKYRRPPALLELLVGASAPRPSLVSALDGLVAGTPLYLWQPGIGRGLVRMVE